MNIGGYPYVTRKHTLCSSEKPNFFNSLLDGVFPVTRDRKGFIFVDRPGKYFEPILEYLITGEVNVPDDLSVAALVREAAFYCIDFPLDETHESLSFVTDSWLLERFENRAYLKIAPLADSVLTIVLKQFKEKADKSLKIETSPFLVKDQTTVNVWLDHIEGGKEYKRFEFIDQQKKLYSNNNSVVNDEFFSLLDVQENRTTITNYCLHNGLTVDIVPVTLTFPGMTSERGSFTFGYKFVHLMNSRMNTENPENRRHFRRSCGKDASRIDTYH
uniref:BTB domain-containing protein n=1 Tax=Arcella intermedia TaxID=1963864 RepID=A0A6B2LCT9_9EUKA